MSEDDALRAVKNPDLAPQPPPDVTRLYPARARIAGLEGHAKVKCRVDVDGKANACEVVEEKPQGYGFGEAALIAIQGVRFTPMLVDCKPVDGGSIQMPFTFQAPD